jgi:hypothetical protein
MLHEHASTAETKMTLAGNMGIEKAMQLIKGGFSYCLKGEFGSRQYPYSSTFLAKKRAQGFLESA